MRILKVFVIGLLLGFPVLAHADANDVPESATWYFHVDLEQMKSEEAGKAVYDWMADEVFTELREESGIDIENELDRFTAYSLEGQGPVFLFEGSISQTSKDRLMTLIAAEGDLQALKASKHTYYRFAGTGDSDDDDNSGIGTDNIEIRFDALQDESWISMSLKNKVVLTSSEDQMKAMLKNGGKIAGSRSHKGSLLVLTAEKTLLQAGMNSGALGDNSDGDSGWESNIVRNTEQVAFLVAAVANKLAIEVKLVTTEEDMAQSLASVVRGLISLVAFNDDMDADAISVLQGTKVEAKGNSLSISVAIDPELIVSTLSD